MRGAQLLEEKLGVDVEILESVGGTGVYERTGSGLADANMEVWALGKEEHYNTWMCSPTRENNCIEQSDNGYTGKTGIYATARDESFLSSSYALDYWQSYLAGSDVLDLVPPADFLQSETSVCSEAHCSSDGRCVSLARHLYTAQHAPRTHQPPPPPSSAASEPFRSGRRN